jgi:hypothetical protein
LIRTAGSIVNASLAKVARASTAWFVAKNSCKFVGQWEHCGVTLCHVCVLWMYLYPSTEICICFKARWLLYVPPGFKILKFRLLPAQCVYVLCGSQNKRRLFPNAGLTGLFLYPRRSVFTAR